jgi:hypothetical protein
VIALLAAALAALDRPDPRPVAPTAAWLEGTWINAATPADRDRATCASGTVIEFRRGGRLLTFEGEGRWTLRGSSLTERYTRLYETGGPEFAATLHRPLSSRLIRVGPHEAMRVAGGDRNRMLRCRPGDRR